VTANGKSSSCQFRKLDGYLNTENVPLPGTVTICHMYMTLILIICTIAVLYSSS
jgi:hypothetical protein